METDQSQHIAPGPWAIRLPVSEASVAAALRLYPGVLATVDREDLWLRGEAMSESLDAILRRLAPSGRFTLSGDSLLTAMDDVLPSARLPHAEWRPIAEVIGVARTTARLVGRVEQRPRLTLRRSTTVRSESMLLTTRQNWCDWASTAPTVRLWPLTFAASIDAVLVRGTPLPPLPGSRFYLVSNVAIPCGWDLYPALDEKTLGRVLSLPSHDIAVFEADGRWQCIAASAFVAATRSAVRLLRSGASA